ncbi:MAG: hypothetical protein RSA12_10010, partial [Clostridia bacterium]
MDWLKTASSQSDADKRAIPITAGKQGGRTQGAIICAAARRKEIGRRKKPSEQKKREDPMKHPQIVVKIVCALLLFCASMLTIMDFSHQV